MTVRIAYLACLLVGCGKAKPADKQVADKAGAHAADPACAAKVKDLEPWLAKLRLETTSHEIDFGPKLQLVDRDPMPVPTHVDAVEIGKASIRGWDISQHDHASNDIPEHATPKQLAEFLAKIHGQKASADEFEPASDDLLRIDVDREASWGDVTHVIDAATAAGYHSAVFAFTATSKLAPPPGVDDTTKTVAAAEAASDQLQALDKRCKPLRRASSYHRSKIATEDAAAYAKDIAAELLECNCAVDPGELRKLAWIDSRWHQAVPRVGVVVALDGSATTTITLPAKTPWSEAHAKLLEATGPVKLAAK